MRYLLLSISMFIFWMFATPVSAQVTIDDLVPEWKPGIERNIDNISERCEFYWNKSKTIVVFAHGTCVFVEDGLSDEASEEAAIYELSGFLKSHPDIHPMQMKDGNLLIMAPHLDVFTVVLEETMDTHQDLIKANHLKALPSHEVILTADGPNVFDTLGHNMLFGRTFIFWDAQELTPVKIIRPKT